MMSAIIAFDTTVLEALYAIRDPNIVQIMIWISELGRWQAVYGLAVCFALVLFMYKARAYAIGLAVSVALSGIGVVLLKEIVERARPLEAFQAYPEVWYSFPSSHAALTMALYGFLTYLALRHPSPFMRTALIGACILVIGLVAFSRIYLGVHYVSDIIAGLVLGALSLHIGIRIATHLKK